MAIKNKIGKASQQMIGKAKKLIGKKDKSGTTKSTGKG